MLWTAAGFRSVPREEMHQLHLRAWRTRSPWSTTDRSTRCPCSCAARYGDGNDSAYVHGLNVLCQEEGLDPGFAAQQQGSVLLYRNLLQLCTRNKDLLKAKQVHAHLAKHGWESNIFLSDLLVTTLVNCGGLADGLPLFQRLSHRNVFSWTAIISGFIDAGRCQDALMCYEQMQGEGVQPNSYTFVVLLKACSKLQDLEGGKRIHADVCRHGAESDVFVASSLVSMYSKCGSIMDARQVFDGLPYPDVVAWNSMLAAYAQQDRGEEALNIFWGMIEQGFTPQARTFVNAIQACGSLKAEEDSVLVDGHIASVKVLHVGKVIHTLAAAHEFESNIFIGNSLVSMYAKCGSIKDAENVFHRLSRRNVVSWSAMIAAYAHLDQADDALRMYRQMQNKGVRAGARTFVSALQACGSLAEQEAIALVDGRKVKIGCLQMGKEIHVAASDRGFGSDVFVGSTLVSMYAKCGSIRDADAAFATLSGRNLVTWNAIISAHAQEEDGGKALQLYAQMQAEGVKPDEGTFVSVLEACSNSGALGMSTRIHEKIVESGLQYNRRVANCLIHAYSKCGSMVEAQQVFNSVPHPDVVSWSAMISGYAGAGKWEVCVELFDEMRRAGVQANGVTFLALLSACNHAGMVDKGLEYFESMSRIHGICAGLEHYSCVIDLLGRSGRLREAEELLAQMPMQPDLPVWSSLLASCRKHGDVTLGLRAFLGAVELEPGHAAAYAIMSNILADAGMCECAKMVDDLREQAFARKRKAGMTWIEHEKEVHTFKVEDRRHHQYPLLCGILAGLTSALEEAGNIPEASLLTYPRASEAADVQRHTKMSVFR